MEKRECQNLDQLIEEKQSQIKTVELGNGAEELKQNQEHQNRLTMATEILENINFARIVSTSVSGLELEMLDSKVSDTEGNCLVSLKLNRSLNGETKLLDARINSKSMSQSCKEVIRMAVEMNDPSFLITELRNKILIQKARKNELQQLQSKYEIIITSMDTVKINVPSSTNCMVFATVQMDDEYPIGADSYVQLTGIYKKDSNRVLDKLSLFKRVNPTLSSPSIKALISSIEEFSLEN